MNDLIGTVATSVSSDLGKMVTDDQIPPAVVLMGATRAALVFWMGCVEDGNRAEALNVVKQVFEEEVNNLLRGIANGMVPA